MFPPAQCRIIIAIIAAAGALGLEPTPIVLQGYAADEARVHVVWRVLCMRLVGWSTVGRMGHAVDMALLGIGRSSSRRRLRRTRSRVKVRFRAAVGVGPGFVGGFGRSYSSYRR